RSTTADVLTGQLSCRALRTGWRTAHRKGYDEPTALFPVVGRAGQRQRVPVLVASRLLKRFHAKNTRNARRRLASRDVGGGANPCLWLQSRGYRIDSRSSFSRTDDLARIRVSDPGQRQGRLRADERACGAQRG